MDAGAEQVANPRYAGTWYKLSGGQGEFGIRTKSSLKSVKYGTEYTVDLRIVFLQGELEKVKF